jgi:putative sterol carrier protein
MAQTAREFFESLESRLNASGPGDITGVYRFDISGAGSWRVDLANGKAEVTESNEGGDCVVSMNENVFLRVLSGDQNPMTAFLMGKIRVDGDMGMVMRLKDLLG